MIHRPVDGEVSESDIFVLSGHQMERIRPFSHWLTGFRAWMTAGSEGNCLRDPIRHGLQRKDALKVYGLHKTLYNRFISSSR
ncbi:transposase [Acetobacter aceti NRIC 0242]|uniref:Transposase n=1 Tax=Acetobacter aceti NBRC 14818 TaxID=887700 RepID=A0AB33IND8_ACEAC|nr:hypothetical protein EMQ_2778 [Acetobacter aceti NBRC 14818]GAN58615.1 transposase [Acetobacter aceti NBRC 14818]GBO81504.1 transposase [Acetobacter aceti NRIC 0242]